MKIFCSGIGGIGLSAYAALQNASGHTVSGSDRCDSALLEDLRSQGIPIDLQQDGIAIKEDTDLFVYSEAIDCDAPDRLRATELGIRQISYFEALGELSSDYTVIATCGSHGKSTTTAMITQLLVERGIDPTVVVGTKLPLLHGRNWRKGSSPYFVVEACEYRRNFRFLKPDIVLITNADGDHFDAFDGLEDYHAAFCEFISQLPPDGVVIAHGADSDAMRIASTQGHTVIDADAFRLPKLTVPGLHMQYNAQLVSALAEYLGIDDAENALQHFSGTWRRMEIKGRTKEGAVLIDDYAHHPVEIAATVQAVKEAYPDKRFVCLYQPHLHERTRTFYDAFGPSFQGIDMLLMSDIYEARSEVSDPVDTKVFAQHVQQFIDGTCLYSGTLDQSQNMLSSDFLSENDVLVIMGAGDVTDVGEAILKQ